VGSVRTAHVAAGLSDDDSASELRRTAFAERVCTPLAAKACAHVTAEPSPQLLLTSSGLPPARKGLRPR